VALRPTLRIGPARLVALLLCLLMTASTVSADVGIRRQYRLQPRAFNSTSRGSGSLLGRQTLRVCSTDQAQRRVAGDLDSVPPAPLGLHFHDLAILHSFLSACGFHSAAHAARPPPHSV